MANKVEICGVNTANLPKLKNSEMDELMIKIKQGDENARELFVSANLRLVLSVVHRFSYKNENPDEMAFYSYKIKLNKSGEYKIKLDVYYGTSVNYDGVSSMYISSRQTLDMGDTYIKVASLNDIEDEEINKTLIEVTEIVNTIVIPIIYGLITIVLIIKGALIGTAIVKSADDPQVRQEKIGSLKWLVIGVVVAYSANTVVGVFTGFFKKLF